MSKYHTVGISLLKGFNLTRKDTVSDQYLSGFCSV